MPDSEIVTINHSEFSVSFYGPLTNPNSIILNDSLIGVDKSNPSAKLIKSIASLKQATEYPIAEISLQSRFFNKSDFDIEINTDFTKSGEEVYAPIFWENTYYSIQMDYNVGNWKITHESPSIDNTIIKSEKRKVLSGRFTFGNNVGVTEFNISKDRQVILKLRFTVYSIKLDFYHDRFSMINTLRTIQDNLLIHLFRPTQTYSKKAIQRGKGLEWLVNFNSVTDEVIRTVKKIENKGHQNIFTQERLINLRKLKKPSKDLIRKLSRNGRFGKQKAKINVRMKLVGVNTPENKYIKYLVNKLCYICNHWINYAKKIEADSRFSSANNSYLINKISRNLKTLKNISFNPFWKAVGDPSPVLHNKTNFMFQDLFVKFEKLYILINKGINLHVNGSRQVSSLGLNQLYELWTYCKLVEVIYYVINKKIVHIKDLVKIKSDSYQSIFKTGSKSKIKINNDYSIYLKAKYSTDVSKKYFSPRVTQEPDLVAEIHQDNNLYLFDAKYRIGVYAQSKLKNNKDLIIESFEGQKVKVRPKNKDINEMHRYLDAIRSTDPSQPTGYTRPSKIGIILYPYKPQKSEREDLVDDIHESIKHWIGAIPFSPGTIDGNWKSFYKYDVIPLHQNTEQIRAFAYLIDSIVN